MGELRGNVSWLEPITLASEFALQRRDQIVKDLRRKLRKALTDQGYFYQEDLNRCVYIIRMTGDFIISYPTAASPVLYVGRGSALNRLATHLKNWLSDVEKFGRNVRIEIRICRPRRRAFDDLFKYVEADLLRMFCERYGSIPFFNSRRERAYENYARFTKTDLRLFRAAIGVGKGKRPKWAIAPTPANRNYDTYYRGHDEGC